MNALTFFREAKFGNLKSHKSISKPYVQKKKKKSDVQKENNFWQKFFNILPVRASTSSISSIKNLSINIKNCDKWQLQKKKTKTKSKHERSTGKSEWSTVHFSKNTNLWTNLIESIWKQGTWINNKSKQEKSKITSTRFDNNDRKASKGGEENEGKVEAHLGELKIFN